MKIQTLLHPATALVRARASHYRLLQKTLVVLAPFVMGATLSHAAILFDQNFDNLTAGGLNGQGSWTAQSDVNVTAGGLGYNNGSIVISGGANHIQSNSISPNTATPLATTSFAAQTGDVWFSFTMKAESVTNGSRFWFWASDNTDINSGFTGGVSTSQTNNSIIYSETRLNTSATFTTSVNSLVSGNTYFFVVRLSKDGPSTNANAYDRVELWVNPSSSSLGAAAISERTDTTTTTLSQFGLTALATATPLQWDNLLIGTTQADVLGLYAIPEPSTYAALGGLSVLGLATLRRRRR
jgi:hypothetical protein